MDDSPNALQISGGAKRTPPPTPPRTRGGEQKCPMPHSLLPTPYSPLPSISPLPVGIITKIPQGK